MEKKEIFYYTITLFSLVVLVYLVFGALSKTPNIADKNPTGNAIFNLDNNFNVGDNLTASIILNNEETNSYGILLLTKDDTPILTKTFSLKEIPKNKINNLYSLNIGDFIDYKFEEPGNYELFFSISDLNVSTSKRFNVK